MPTDYLKSAYETMTTLPLEKQEEVYDFVNFLKMATVHSPVKHRTKKGSVRNIIGLGKSGLCDISLNHDKYLYDE